MVAVLSQAWSAERCAALLQKAQKSPTGWKACCPAHDDRNPSLFLADGKDGLALRCYRGCSYRDIVQALENLGAKLTQKNDGIPDCHPQLGEYHQHWDYHDTFGQPILRICRWQKGSSKDIRPLAKFPDGWKWQAHTNPRPLFQLDRLANEPDKSVLVVEGEKAAHAAQHLFPEYIATTWPGGAQSTGHADWTPLKGRSVVLVPDCDQPGRKAMEWVRTKLTGVAATVSIVDPAEKIQGLKEGWDLADALKDDIDVSGWLDAPKPVTRLKRLSEIIAEPTRPRWLIRDVLEQSVIGILLGPRGTYKSFVAIHWAMTIAVEGSPIVIVSAEGRGIDRRLRAWLTKHAPNIKPHNLPVYVIEQRVDFNSLESLSELCKEIDTLEAPPVLIIIDTLSKNSGGLDENSNSEVKAYIGNLDVHLKRRYGSTVLLVHHTGHVEKGRARGASALEADTDAAYVINRASDTRDITVSRARFKDSGDLAPLAYRAEVVGLGEFDDDGRPVTSLALIPIDPETVATERRGSAPRGRWQRDLMAHLMELQAKSETTLLWGPPELRRISRELGMRKQTAQETCAALATWYLQACAFGAYRLRDEDIARSKKSKKSNSGPPGPGSKNPPKGDLDRRGLDPVGPETPP